MTDSMRRTAAEMEQFRTYAADWEQRATEAEAEVAALREQQAEEQALGDRIHAAQSRLRDAQNAAERIRNGIRD